MRTCPRCGVELATTKRSDAVYCSRRCVDASKKVNPDVHRRAQRAYYERHREQIRAYQRSEPVLARKRERWRSAPDEVKELRKLHAVEWLEANRESVKAKALERARKHKDERLGRRQCRLCGREIDPRMKATATHCSDACAKATSKLRLRWGAELAPLAESIYLLKKEATNRA